MQRKAEIALAKAYRKLHQKLLDEIADEIRRIEKVLDAGGWLLVFKDGCPGWLVKYVHRLALLDGIWRYLFTNRELPLKDFHDIWQISQGAERG